jgi:hypothetical protein
VPKKHQCAAGVRPVLACRLGFRVGPAGPGRDFPNLSAGCIGADRPDQTGRSALVMANTAAWLRWL